MQTIIYLVRHGHSEYSRNELERGLSEKGRRDVERVTQVLVEQKVEAIVSSHYRRAIETVEGAAQALGLAVEPVADFRERTLSSQYVEDFMGTITRLWENPDYSLEGGESNTEAQQRGIRALQDILERFEGKRVAVGTHGNLMALIMNYFDKRYDFEFWQGLTMPDVYRLSFEDGRLAEACRLLRD